MTFSLTPLEALVIALFIVIPVLAGRVCPVRGVPMRQRSTQPSELACAASVVWTSLINGIAFVCLLRAGGTAAGGCRMCMLLLCTSYALTVLYIILFGCVQNLRASLAVMGVALTASVQLVVCAAAVRPVLGVLLVPQCVWNMYVALLTYQALVDQEN
jgi:tryptophan-rich sensory protein